MEFYLNFLSGGYGLHQIDEPIGFDATPFGIKQDEGRKGRDVVYAGNGDAKFTITKAVDVYGYHFDRFVKDFLRYGFELQIEFSADWGNGITVIGDVADVEYNGFDTINFIVRQRRTEAKFKQNYETETNLFSTEDVDGNPITPPQTVKFLQKAKPITQISSWGLASFDIDLDAPTQPNEFAFNSPSVFFNPLQQQVEYEVGSSLSWLTNYDVDSGEPFRLVTAATNLNNVTIEFNLNVLYKYRPNEFAPGLDKAGSLGLFVRWGQDFATAQGASTPVWYNGSTAEDDADFQMPPNLSFTIPSLQTTDSIWVYWRAASQNGAVNRIQFDINDKIKITVKSIALNTVFDVYRYIDAIKYAVKSASGLDVYAPRYDFGGEMYDTFLTVPSLMRGLTDKPVNLSCKEFIEDHIRPENNGDYEIDAQGRVFLGWYRDFYRNYEIGSFEQDLYEGFTIKKNERYFVKRIKNGFKYYASQKENETENTYDIVHGEEQVITPNQNATNEREALSGFIRDAYLLSLTQRKSYDLTKSAATQDDDKKYLIDGVTLQAGTHYTETFLLQHLYDSTNQRLILRNTSVFSWSLLGVGVGTTFQILTTANAGVYTVFEVTPTELILNATGGTDILGENTTFTYYIDPDIIWTNRTNEGFDMIEGLADGDNYSNLAYTTKRVLKKFFAEEVATMSIYQPNKEVRTTLYKNNPDCVTLMTGESLPIREGENYIPTGAIVTGMEYEGLTLLMSLQQYWDMQALLRTERGFIRTWQENGLPIKGYLKQGEFTVLGRGESDPNERWGKLECTLEEKYEPFYMEIYADADTFMINGEIQLSGFRFRIDDTGYLSIFDSVGKLAFTPIPYDRVKINNSGSANSPEQLGTWLSQYSIDD